MCRFYRVYAVCAWFAAFEGFMAFILSSDSRRDPCKGPQGLFRGYLGATSVCRDYIR